MVYLQGLRIGIFLHCGLYVEYLYLVVKVDSVGYKPSHKWLGTSLSGCDSFEWLFYYYLDFVDLECGVKLLTDLVGY